MAGAYETLNDKELLTEIDASLSVKHVMVVHRLQIENRLRKEFITPSNLLPNSGENRMINTMLTIQILVRNSICLHQAKTSFFNQATTKGRVV